jgi:hypothetical protein
MIPAAWGSSVPILAWLMAITPVLPSPLVGQDRSRFWLGAGLGSAARSDGASGFALMGEIVYQVKALTSRSGQWARSAPGGSPAETCVRPWVTHREQ